MPDRRRIRRSPPHDTELAPSPAELRAALVQARKRWRLAQEAVRGHEGLYGDGLHGVEVSRDRHVEHMLDVVRRQEWITSFAVEQLEELVHGRAPRELPEILRGPVQEAIRALVAAVRHYRERHGHLPDDGPFRRARWAG